MKTITKTIRQLGNSSGIIIDKIMEFQSGISVGDTVEIKCSKDRIVLKKITPTLKEN